MTVLSEQSPPTTLDDLAAATGEALVGTRGMALLGPRFPLLAKLIDAGDWLSLQVHPDDALAEELYGPGALGKTEAWVVLDALPGSTLVTGPSPDLPEAELLALIGAGAMDRQHCEVQPAQAGDVLLVMAGTIHAIGAGTFVYEIEQPSDLTFRISDWGRPAVAGRALHRAEALRAVVPSARAVDAGRAWRLDGGALAVRELRLELVGDGAVAERAPAGGSLEVVTALTGPATITGEGWEERLERWETLVVPASAAAYRIRVDDGAHACVADIP
jgi:mannose-6-phosphate isomerase